MTTTSQRFAAAFLLAATVLLGLPSFSQAATSPWSWNDISNQLTVRNNRPVWAMAYANGNWFYTDGLDLWNGGQVYRYDGATQVNITLEVRNAGLNRVDDIVTDGTSVIFFKDIFRLDNQVEALRYRDGSYSNITSSLRSALDSNEGISSIVGRNGIWMMVTTRARLVRFSENFSSYSRIVSPARLKQLGSSDASLLYHAQVHVSRFESPSVQTIILAPAGNRFLLGATSELLNTKDSGKPYRSAFWVYDGNTLQEIQAPADYIRSVAWNQSRALLAIQTQNAGSAPIALYTFDGYTWTNGPWLSAPCYGYPCTNIVLTSDATMTWDGVQWMIISGKNLYRYANDTIEQIDTLRDYFLTATSNGFGTILLGGAESNLSTNGPIFPLQAKLVKVTNDGGASQTTNNSNNNTNTQTSNGISAWSWFEPNQSFLRRDQNVTFGAGAWSDKGIKRMEIYVNGNVRKTCDLGNATGNQQCTYSIWGGEFALGTNVAVNAKITSGNDQVLWTDLKTLNVTDVNGSVSNPTPSNTSANTNIWNWSEPETSQIKTNESAKFFVGANDPEGIQKIEFYVNGSIWNSCNLGNAYGNQTCSVTVNGSSFSAGSDVFVNAKITDSQGNFAWSASRTYRINAANGSTNPTPSTGTSPTTSWNWSEPEKSQLSSGEQSTFRVGAYDADGIQRIDVWVNGVVKQTCNFGTAYGNRECAYTIVANDFTAGSTVFVNAAIVDTKGETTWSGSRSYSIVSSNSTNTSGTPATGSDNLPGSIQVTSNRDNGFYANDTITVTANAQDQNGIRRIDLFVNGTLYKTCTNVGSCSVTVGPFSDHTTISYGATIVDNAGYAIWTGAKTVSKK